MVVRVKSAPTVSINRGAEGMRMSIQPTFSARNAFKPASIERDAKASQFRRIPDFTPKVSLGVKPQVRSPHMEMYQAPQSVRKDIDVKIAPKEKQLSGKKSEVSNIFKNTKPLILNPVPQVDRSLGKAEAIKALKGQDFVTLYDRKATKPESTPQTVLPQRQNSAEKANAPLKTEQVVSKPQVVNPLESIKSESLKRAESKPTPTNLSEIGLNLTKETTNSKPQSDVIKKPATQPDLSRIRQVQELLKNTAPKTREALVQPGKATSAQQAQVDLAKPASSSKAIETLQQRTLAEMEGVKHKEISPSPITAREKTTTASPLEILKQKSEKKAVTLPTKQLATEPVAETKIQTSTEKKPAIVHEENRLLQSYLRDYVFTDNKEQVSPEAVIKKMSEKITQKSSQQPGSKLQEQLLGDSIDMTEAVKRKKVADLVAQTRVTLALAQLQGKDMTIVRKKAMDTLHAKIQSTGLASVFLTLKSMVVEEVLKETYKTQIAQNNKAAEKEKKANEQQNPEQEESEEHNSVEIERDPVADKARRTYLKKAANLAFLKAEAEVREGIQAEEIVRFAGMLQVPSMKSEPVRLTGSPDHSLTETYLEILKDGEIKDITQADQIIDEKVDRLAPVRLRKNPKHERRGLIDLFRVFGNYLASDEQQKYAA